MPVMTVFERCKNICTAAVSWTLPLSSSVVVYTLLSILLAATLTLGSSWRLGLIVLILSVFLGVGSLFAHIVEQYGFPLLERAASMTLIWLRGRHGKLTGLFHGRLAGFSTELPLVVLLAGTVMGGAWLFFGILEDVVSGDPLVSIDQAVFRLLQALRTPAGDAFLVAMTELGDRSMIIAVVTVMATSFLLIQRWRAALYLVLATLGSTVFVLGMKVILHRIRPLHIYDGLSEFSFPSGHATSSTVVYAFLAIVLARHAAPALRRALIVGTLSLIIVIAFSRLYLGAHWLSDVGAGLSFGMARVAALAIIHFRQDTQPLPSAKLALVLALTVMLTGAWHISGSHSADMARYGARADETQRQ